MSGGVRGFRGENRFKGERPRADLNVHHAGEKSLRTIAFFDTSTPFFSKLASIG